MLVDTLLYHKAEQKHNRIKNIVSVAEIKGARGQGGKGGKVPPAANDSANSQK